MKLKWTDVDAIAEILYDRFSELDPLYSISPTLLRIAELSNSMRTRTRRGTRFGSQANGTGRRVNPDSLERMSRC